MPAATRQSSWGTRRDRVPPFSDRTDSESRGQVRAARDAAGYRMKSLTLMVGEVQAWLAKGYREGTPLERICIYPSWLVFRLLFLAGRQLFFAR